MSTLQLETFEYVNRYDMELSSKFLNLSQNRYILGRGKYSDSVIEQIQIDGIIDDFTNDNTHKGYKIYKMADIPIGSIVVSATVSAPKTIKEKLSNLGIMNIDYFAFYRYSSLVLKPPAFMDDFKIDFENNRCKYEWIYSNLADSLSKKIFKDVINFKITFDLKFMVDYNNETTDQYFEDFYCLPENPTFIDGGGYIGDTSLIFINKFKNYKKIFLFEPLKDNMKLAKENLTNHQCIDFYEIGLSSFCGEVFFDENADSSSISLNGLSKIQVNYLDNIINEPVDFIKLDIEGSEQDAIDGAINTIIKSKPIMAICIYHKANDWYKIAEKILSIYSDYKIYLRHYMEGIFETVMYFVPPDKISVKR